MSEKSVAENRTAARQWTGRILMAVIFGLAIWNLIVSLMTNVVVPWLGSLAGPNAGLPESFTRNYDYPDLLVAVLEFCVAGIVALSINWFFQRSRKAQAVVQTAFAPAPSVARPVAPSPQANVVRPVSEAPARVVSAQPVTAPMTPNPVATPSSVAMAGGAASKPAPAHIPAAQPAAPPVKASVSPAPPAPKAEPVKPKKEKPVYYNIVGEPVPDDED